MKYVIPFAVLFAVPTVARAAASFDCQLRITPGYNTPSDLTAVDAVTGKTLFALKAGESVSQDRCINAPNHHGMVVTGPQAGQRTTLPGF